MPTSKVLMLMATVVLVGACAPPGANMPLVFGQSHTVGISIGGTSTDQGVDLTLGYKDKSVAVVPVTVGQKEGGNTQIKSTAGSEHQDALSVLGQFELDSNATQGDVGLGKFFATGIAAKTLADGFSEKLSK